MDTTTIGIAFDAAAFIAIFIYSPIANYFIRQRQIEEKEWNFPEDQMYECEM